MKLPAAIAVLACAPLFADTLPNILARMDAASKKFVSVSAKMHRTQFTPILNETEVTDGQMRLKRGKGGLVGVVEFEKPDVRTIQFTGSKLRIYYPKANTVENYDASKYTKSMDRFLLLGFGTSKEELTKDFNVVAGPVENLKSGPATRLDLTPKPAELKKLFSKIELWIPDGQSNPVQEKVYLTSKETMLVEYSDLKINPAIPPEQFELNLGKGVKEMYPQK